MDNQATLYTRKHYTLIDIFEEQGGLIKQVTLIALLLMKPFIFKRHDLTVFQDHVEKSDMKKFKYNEAKLERIQKSFFPAELYVFMCYAEREIKQLLSQCWKKGTTEIYVEKEAAPELQVETIDDLVDKMKELKDKIYDIQSLSALDEVT